MRRFLQWPIQEVFQRTAKRTTRFDARTGEPISMHTNRHKTMLQQMLGSGKQVHFQLKHRFNGYSNQNFTLRSFFCLFQIAKHLPNSPVILCGSIDRDVYRERAYLFIQDCKGTWINTNLSAGREYCCKDGSPYKCANNLI